MSRYKWIHQFPDGSFRYGEATMRSVGIEPDGSLWNPNGYPEDEVRAAVMAADERRAARRGEAAKKAAATRKARREREAYKVVEEIRILGGAEKLVQPRTHCRICGKTLSDDDSLRRGIGSECWQSILSIISRQTEEQGAEA